MKSYNIVLASKEDNHFHSQSDTSVQLSKAGIIDRKWNMSTRRHNGDVLHGWIIRCSDDSLLWLKLSADVVKIVEIVD
jgi:hypothetical protein